MANAYLYQPRNRWRFGAAFGAAALIHFAAVGLASIHQQKPINAVASVLPGIPEMAFEPPSPTNVSTPPPDVTVPALAPNPRDDPFPEEKPKPPPVRNQINRPALSTHTERNGTSGSFTLSTANALALHAPRPEYPYEARRQKITGDGVVVMTVDPTNGRVTVVSMWKSTGTACLDNAALAGFRRWRFKPGTVSSVKTPVTFTISGAQY